MISKLIAAHLAKNKRLVVPQLGAFIHKEEQGTLLFVPLLKKDDGVLTQLLQTQFGVEPSEAQAMTSEFIAEINTSIAQNGAYNIEGIGKLSPDANGSLFLSTTSATPAPAITTSVAPAVSAPTATVAPVSSTPAPASQPATATTGVVPQPIPASEPLVTPVPNAPQHPNTAPTRQELAAAQARSINELYGGSAPQNTTPRAQGSAPRPNTTPPRPTQAGTPRPQQAGAPRPQQAGAQRPAPRPGGGRPDPNRRGVAPQRGNSPQRAPQRPPQRGTAQRRGSTQRGTQPNSKSDRFLMIAIIAAALALAAIIYGVLFSNSIPELNLIETSNEQVVDSLGTNPETEVINPNVSK